jgi:hypothetical protein
MLNLPNPVWTIHELGNVDNPLVANGLLKELPRDNVAKCPCENGHWEEVSRISNGSGNVADTLFCPYSGCFVQLPKNALRRWSFDGGRLAEMLADEMHCVQKQIIPLLPNQLWSLGESQRAIAGRRRQVFLALRLSESAEHLYRLLPTGKTPILFCAGANAQYTNSFDSNRIFLLHEVAWFEHSVLNIDMAILNDRLSDKPVEQPKAKVAGSKSRNDAIMKIKEELRARLQGANRHYWHHFDNGNGEKLLPRPTLEQIATAIGRSTSTVSRIINSEQDRELTMLWQGGNDVNFVKQYRR